MLFRLAETCGKRIEEQQRWSACWRVPDHSAEGERQPRVHPPVHRPDRPQAHSQGDTIRYVFFCPRTIHWKPRFSASGILQYL